MSAAITDCTRRATSSATSGSLTSPTTSSILPLSTAFSPWRADSTLEGIIPSEGRWPTYLAFENTAAQAESPSDAGACAHDSAVSVSRVHSGCSTAASAARRAAAPASPHRAESLTVEPAGRSRSDLGAGARAAASTVPALGPCAPAASLRPASASAATSVSSSRVAASAQLAAAGEAAARPARHARRACVLGALATLALPCVVPGPSPPPAGRSSWWSVRPPPPASPSTCPRHPARVRAPPPPLSPPGRPRPAAGGPRSRRRSAACAPAAPPLPPRRLPLLAGRLRAGCSSPRRKRARVPPPCAPSLARPAPPPPPPSRP
eukprot:5302815-Pleurochrysis_carterae.AAC.1